MLRRHASFIAEGEERLLPRKIMRDPGELRVDRARRIPPGESQAKFVPLRQGRTYLPQNELGGVGNEILCADDLATHAERRELDHTMGAAAFCEILLMIFLSSIKCGRRLDLRNYRTTKMIILIQLGFELLRGSLLLERVIKND